jgi:hypothetical protein
MYRKLSEIDKEIFREEIEVQPITQRERNRREKMRERRNP